MRITLLTLGSRGDVQPLVALGQGLLQAGYRVRLCSHENFRKFASEWGLEFVPLASDSQQWIESEAVQKVFELGQGLKWLQEGARWLASLHEELVEGCLAGCSGSDAIIYSPLTYPAWHCAEALKIPALALCHWPTTPTRHSPYPLFGAEDLGPLNWPSYRLFEQLVWQPLRKKTNALRTGLLDLPPLPTWGPYWQPEYRRQPWLYPFSPAVFARPDDWPAEQQLTGYWFLEAAGRWQPPAKLTEFLSAGPPPVAIGFGSMVPRASEMLTQKVLAALQLSGLRAILLSGWGGLRDAPLPDNCLQVESVPHDWLFPRVAAVVHHGGAGTTAAALRAGVPNMAVPFIGDQYFWGRRLERIGAGPAPLPMGNLSPAALAKSIRTMLDDATMHRRAEALGRTIRSEDGVGRAVQLLEAHLERMSSPSRAAR